MANVFQNLLDNYTFPAAKAGRARSRAYEQVAREASLAANNLTTANTAADEVTDIAQHVATVSGGKRSMISVLRTVLRMPRFRALRLMNHSQGVYGVNLGRVLDRTALIEEAVSEILALYQDGAVLPEIAAVFPFDQAGAAHTCLQERRNIGKVLLAV